MPEDTAEQSKKALSPMCAWYLIASQNDVLDLGDVDSGHASEDSRQFDEAVERENEDE